MPSGDLAPPLEVRQNARVPAAPVAQHAVRIRVLPRLAAVRLSMPPPVLVGGRWLLLSHRAESVSLGVVAAIVVLGQFGAIWPLRSIAS